MTNPGTAKGRTIRRCGSTGVATFPAPYPGESGIANGKPSEYTYTILRINNEHEITCEESNCARDEQEVQVRVAALCERAGKMK